MEHAPDFAPGHFQQGSLLFDLKRFDAAVESFSRALALDPGFAEAFNNRGSARMNLQQFGAALVDFDAVLAAAPGFAPALFNRGNALQALGRFAEAAADYKKALARDPGFAAAWNGAGTALHALGHFDEALASYDRALALQPRFGEAFYNRGLTLSDLKRHEAALVSYSRAVALESHPAAAARNQAFCHLLLGRFDPGWRLYEWRKWRDEVPAFRIYPQPLWLGKEDISGKTLFVYWEQGLGDTIQFSRYASLCVARGATMILSVQQPLLGLLQQLGSAIRVIGPEEVPQHFDFHCPLLSLPLAFGTTLTSIPAPLPLAADDATRRQWAARLPPGAKLRIGLVWKGAASHVGDRHRSLTPEQILPLLGPEFDWIVLQKDASEEELALLRQAAPVRHFGDAQKDFSDTAAIIEQLDLVITVDTSVAHLAGAMGKPVWILLPYNPDFRWLLDREDSPWYPSARLIRQPQSGNWAAVMARVKSELASLPA